MKRIEKSGNIDKDDNKNKEMTDKDETKDVKITRKNETKI